ncbi:hypothetical protein MRX96_049237 [Rhipicephalus microplus]
MATAPPPPPPGLQQPPPLDFDTTSKWPAWIHFDEFRYTSGLNERSDEVQVRTLLYTIGRQARDIFVTFNLSAEDSKKYELVKKKFDEHFIKEMNVVYDGACFHKRNQMPGESIDQFMTALHILAEKSLAKARLKQTVQQQQAELRNSNKVRDSTQCNPCEEVNVDAVGHRTKRRRSEDTRPPAVRYERQCIFCGGHLHPRTDCPARAQKCFNCGVKGHFGKFCLKGTSPSNKRKV